MEKFILQNESASDRLEQLKNSADKMEQFSYPRELSNGEIQELQSNLSQDMIFVDKEDQKLKVAKEVFKSATKPVKQNIAKNLQMIRSQVEEVSEEVYLLKDIEDGKMGYYSKEGVLVFERNLRPDEQQYSIQDHLRKAQ
ncbi:hypothetical protein [Flavobacterium algicola]|uniref:hypothetical protein n=1 Tax=Flavobacterium algicola TaxID=556529 RepID=UPI001EFCDFC4|nr:hypothetical protein [Flavobacterium algicola]MCG9792509.1 hypothetical protein [Flavobacterium algicola]